MYIKYKSFKLVASIVNPTFDTLEIQREGVSTDGGQPRRTRETGTTELFVSNWCDCQNPNGILSGGPGVV